MKTLHYFIIYKPYQVLCQFSPEGEKRTLKHVFDVPHDVYPVGRLDHDSEGLLLLTNDAALNSRLLHPAHAHEREYYVQVEGEITAAAIAQLQRGVSIPVNGKAYNTRPCKAIPFDTPPAVPVRNPPIRFRKHIPDSWLSITLTEGKNRQVRKMLASTGFPVLRLIRHRIASLTAAGMQPGDLRSLPRQEMYGALFDHN